MTDVVSTLVANGWEGFAGAATPDDLAALEAAFETELPSDYAAVLRFSNGGSLYGFQQPVILYHPVTVLALYREFDFYEAIPRSIIFGGDGGGTIYVFDLRDGMRQQVLVLDQGHTSYDYVLGSFASLSDMIAALVANEQIDPGRRCR